MVRSSVERASLWNVMMTLVSGKSSRYFFVRHLQPAQAKPNVRLTSSPLILLHCGYLHGTPRVGYFAIAGQRITGLLIEAISYVGIFATAQRTASYVAGLIEIFHLTAGCTPA